MDRSPDIFERLIEVILVLMLIFMPMAFGAVDAWSEFVVVGLAAVMSLCFVIRWMICHDKRIVRSWVYLPMALFILLIVLQLVPWPTALMEKMASGTTSIKRQLLSDVPQADTILSSMTLSFYPQGTIHDLLMVLVMVSVFIVVLNTYDRPAMIKRLLGVMAGIGGGIALLAIAQVVTRTDKVYWLIPIPIERSIATSGPFLNHSHFGQFMNLSLGAAIAWIMVTIQERFNHRRVMPSQVIDYLGSSQSRVLWLFIAIVVLGMASIFTSLTRGGIVSMLIAGSFTALLMSLHGSIKGRGQIMAMMALAAFVCILYIGFDATYERLATLQDVSKAEGGRWQIIKDIASAWTRFPIFGSGLGTHAVVYPMFQRSLNPSLISHAENEYVQALEETGLLGFGIFVIVAMFVWTHYWRAVRRHNSQPIHVAVYGLGFGLLGIMIHSLTDFGQHLPSNAVLTAIYCALLIRLALLQPEEARSLGEEIQGKGRLRLVLGIPLLLFVCAIGIWGIRQAHCARIAETHGRAARNIERELTERDWQGTNEQFTELITHMAAAAEFQPRSIHYRHWLNVYRWQSVSQIKEPNSHETVLVPEAIEFTRQIIRELQETRNLCPTFGATWCLLGQLEAYVIHDNLGREHIRRGFQLAPCDPIVCLTAAGVDALEGKREEAFQKLTRAAALDNRYFQEAAIACIQDLGDPNLAVAMAGDDIWRLSVVANLLAGMGQSALVDREVREKIVEQLGQKAKQEDAPAHVLASLANIQRSQGDVKAAAANYQRALILDYAQVGWRYNLAQCLVQERQIDNAIREARICLRLRPDFKPAKQLIAELSAQVDKAESLKVAGEETRRL